MTELETNARELLDVRGYPSECWSTEEAVRAVVAAMRWARRDGLLRAAEMARGAWRVGTSTASLARALTSEAEKEQDALSDALPEVPDEWDPFEAD